MILMVTLGYTVSKSKREFGQSHGKLCLTPVEFMESVDQKVYAAMIQVQAQSDLALQGSR